MSKTTQYETSHGMQLVIIFSILGAFALIGFGGLLLHGADLSCKFCKIWWDEFLEKEKITND